MTDSRPPQQPLVPPGGHACHVADMTATFSADLTLASVQEVLQEHEQWLPIDGDPSRSLGELVERNSSGPLRLGFGAWRDLLTGCQFRNGRGQLITAGGRTVKNVAGYDLTKFMVGQHGVFGRLVTITTRTYRRPAGVIVARFDADAKLLLCLLPTPLRPQYAMITSQGMECGYMGDVETLEYYRTQLQAQTGVAEVVERSVEEDIAYRAARWTAKAQAAGEVGFRASVPPVNIMRFLEGAKPSRWAADAAFGIVMGSVAKDEAAMVSRAAADAGGSLYFTHADGTLGAIELDEAQQLILQRLKHAFDPEGRLTPLPGREGLGEGGPSDDRAIPPHPASPQRGEGSTSPPSPGGARASNP